MVKKCRAQKDVDKEEKDNKQGMEISVGVNYS